MSTERDELRELIRAVADAWLGDGGRPGTSPEGCVADAILAAGYRKPRQVTAAAELDALPVDSTVLDAKGFVYQKWVDLDEPDLPWWALVGDSRQYPARRITLPATVIHEGGPDA